MEKSILRLLSKKRQTRQFAETDASLLPYINI